MNVLFHGGSTKASTGLKPASTTALRAKSCYSACSLAGASGGAAAG
ncbi:hypothetical protein KCP78_16020 [Salmonella enterica subsp. enterica]|nr:hypothetical protein KCP78_16020 [Salmonella enterica subsp. enterica]